MQALLLKTLELFQIRLSLAQIELQEELVYFKKVLLLIVAALFFALLALLLGAFALIALTWDTAWRMPVLLGMPLGFLVLAGLLWWGYRRTQIVKPRAFSATCTELSKDKEMLLALLTQSAVAQSRRSEE